jgi:hypothetical protein
LANLLSVPNYVKATSPLGLRRLMLNVQIKDSMQYNFFNVQFAQGYWFAWYFKEPKTDTEKQQVFKEITGGINGISKE